MLKLLERCDKNLWVEGNIYMNKDMVSKFQINLCIQQASFCLLFLFIFSFVRDGDVKYGQINLI